MNAIIEAKQRVNNLLEERNRLKDELASAEATAKRVRERLGKIEGSPWDRYGGELARAKSKLADAKRDEADKTLPRVVWQEGHSPRDEYQRHDGDWVLEKVTPKRICIRKAGLGQTELFNRDGTHISRGRKLRIDIEKTFPEGLQ